jgi:hypothetical protein
MNDRDQTPDAVRLVTPDEAASVESTEEQQ